MLKTANRLRKLRLSGLIYRNFVTETASQSLDDRTDDDKLMRTKDFNGVRRRNFVKRDEAPEVFLSYMQQTLNTTNRISGSSVFEKIIEKIEKNDETLISVLQKSPDRWPGLIIRACGRAMSNVHSSTREILLNRLFSQLQIHKIPITIDTVNARLRSMLDNGTTFSTDEELRLIRQTLNLTPNQETFNLLLEQISQLGDVDACKTMVYEMAREGCVVDGTANSHLVYAFAIRGHYNKCDSMVEQAAGKYDKNARNLALGACAKAAAVRNDIKRLRQIFINSLNSYKKLTIPYEQLFDVIWLLANHSGTDGAEHALIIEQILNCISHETGFFHSLTREIERHLSHGHFYTAIYLLEDIKRVEDCLSNQQRSKGTEHLLARLSHQLIREKTPLKTVLDIANRVVTMFKKDTSGSRFYDNLLQAALMYKDLTVDERIDYLIKLIDVVDRDRTRPHILIPILVTCTDVEERLKVIFRCSVIGYKNISDLDIGMLENLVLQPLHDKQRFNKLDKSAKIMKSFGVSDEIVWKTLHLWWKRKDQVEKKQHSDDFVRPFASDLQKWLQTQYSFVFEQDKLNDMKNTKTTPIYSRLLNIVNERDSSKALAYIESYGWPEDTDYDEIVPMLINLFLEVETWSTVSKLLFNIASQSTRWQIGEDDTKSPVKNFHLLAVLRRMAQEGEELNVRELTDYVYELNRMFPDASATYENFFDTLFEYNRLFYKIFERIPKLNVAKVDECMDLLRTLVKLDLVTLHANETLTTVFVKNVISRIGLEEGINTWMKFQSSLSCSNGLVALLIACLQRNDDQHKQLVNFVLHKAQNSISQSRTNCLHVSVLISMRMYDEALEQLKKNSIDSMDFVSCFRLMNALKFRKIDEDFIYKFVDCVLAESSIGQNVEALKALQAECIRVCEVHDSGPLSLKLYKRFCESNVVFGKEEKSRLWGIVGKHESLAKKWLYEPYGMLRLSENDPINRQRESYEIQQMLKSDIEGTSKQCLSTSL